MPGTITAAYLVTIDCRFGVRNCAPGGNVYRLFQESTDEVVTTCVRVDTYLLRFLIASYPSVREWA